MARGVKEGAATEERRHQPATEEERRFAEELGSYWEDAGSTRMAGRVLGALLLADPPEMSSAELARFLGISSGSVSTATRELIRPGIAERVRIPGDRQDYFRSRMRGSALPQILHSRIELTRRWIRLMERGKELAEHKGARLARQLDEIREFWEFLAAEQEAIADRWEQRQRERRGP